MALVIFVKSPLHWGLDLENLFKQKEYKIIHIDMDCFYAQVEMRDNPSLVGKPVAIGGPSKTKGILCTSNYEARAYGVKSAQATFKAFELCPHLILIPPNFAKYEAESSVIRNIFRNFSDKVQAVSLDEAYLDVTHTNLLNGSATLIARAIKEEIFKQTGLTASAGVSFNKMLAKIGSDWRKPNGLFVIKPEMRKSFMENLPLSKIPGIGKVSYDRYEKLGFRYCGDITRRNLFDLIKLLGKKNALELFRACQGISNSEVKSRAQRKSFGIEKTFFESISDHKQLKDNIDVLITDYERRFDEMDAFHLKNRDVSHFFIKIRFDDFKTYTKEIPIDKTSSKTILELRKLGFDNYQQIKTLFSNMQLNQNKAVRLIGIGIRLKDCSHEQLELNWG